MLRCEIGRETRAERAFVRCAQIQDRTAEAHQLHDAVDAKSYPDRQAFPGELIDQSQQSELTIVMGPRLNEVVAPDMVAMLRSQSDAGSVVEPEPAAWPLLPGYFQPLTTPDLLNAITSDPPAGVGKQGCDPAIAISSILECQGNNRSCVGPTGSANIKTVPFLPPAPITKNVAGASPE